MAGTFEQVMAGLGLEPRPQQVKLTALLRSASPDAPVFAQAGTGTGKSYCVLSNAVERAQLTGKPSVVVCPTNALVDQYVNKDAPEIARVTGATFTHLKGRSHYLCASSKKLQEYDDPEQTFKTLIERHGQYELDKLNLDREFGCPGSKVCAGACGAQMARQAAVNFNVVITNAHVLVWDRRVRDFTRDNTALLPTYGALLVDECHAMEPTVRACLSDEIGPGSRIYVEVPEFKDWVRSRTRDLDEDVRFEPDADALRWRDRSLSIIRQIDEQLHDDASDMDQHDLFDLRNERHAHQRFVDLFKDTDEYGSGYVTILTTTRQVRRSCVDASRLSGEILQGQPSALVSGTVPESLPRRLGAGGAPIHDVGHPFDYGKSTLVVSRYDPRKRSDFHNRIVSMARAIRQTGGGTLVLFTSWADLDQVMPLVYRELRQWGVDCPILLQDKEDPADTARMIEEFKQHGNAVLAGVRTLFTGIDIPGPALRQVILWKLPYSVPTIELQEIEARHGRQVYWDEMLVALVQGVGRLVRRPDDWGRALILDSRAGGQHWSRSPLTRHLAEFAISGPAPTRHDQEVPA